MILHLVSLLYKWNSSCAHKTSDVFQWKRARINPLRAAATKELMASIGLFLTFGQNSCEVFVWEVFSLFLYNEMNNATKMSPHIRAHADTMCGTYVISVKEAAKVTSAWSISISTFSDPNHGSKHYLFKQGKWCSTSLSDKLSVRERNMFSFFSVLLLDDTSKRPLIPHVTKFILLIRSPTGAGSLAALLPNLGPISRPMQMVANGRLL